MIEITNSIFREENGDLTYQESRNMISKWVDSFKDIKDVLSKSAQMELYYTVRWAGDFIKSDFTDRVNKEFFKQNPNGTAIFHESIIATAELLVYYCQQYSDVAMEYGNIVTAKSDFETAKKYTDLCSKYWRAAHNAAFDIERVIDDVKMETRYSGMPKEELKYVQEIKSKMDDIEKVTWKFMRKIERRTAKIFWADQHSDN